MTPASPSPNHTTLKARLEGWARPARGPMALASGLGIAQFAAYAGFAWSAGQALEAFFSGQPALAWLGATLLLAALRAACQAGEIRAGVEASTTVRQSVREQAARALAARGPAFSERIDSGELASTLTDGVEKLDGYFARYRPLMPVMLGGPMILILAAGAVSVTGAIILMVSAPVLILAMALAGAGAAAASRDQLITLQRLAGRFNDRIQTLDTLVAFNAAEREADGLAAAADDFRVRTMRVLRRAFLSSLVLEAVSALAIAAIAIFVGLALMDRPVAGLGAGLTLGEGLFLLLLAPEFYMPLRRFSAAYHDRADAEAAAESLAPLFEGEARDSAAGPKHSSGAPSIGLAEGEVIYPDGRRGLAPLSFTAEAGQITALWGPSGCGKSTVLKALMGYVPLSAGEIRINGDPAHAPLLGQAAWIGQRPRLFHGTLAQNIALFDETIEPARIRAAAEASGAMGFATGLPEGLDTMLGERGYGLSGGQAQRVALARALAADMPVLLLDEPTAHLDGEAEALFLDTLTKAAEGRTVLMATHSPAARAVCARIVDLSGEEAGS
ncbi:thiol reductant ABC exporter subunit CydD [Marinicauda sp. Alg238-R41]|uniref:thiol reductant ABC exporter subunit CydD n=1 Tax=Marinicauda sp. Alg238-R41 TaxID=2993447 RepID=UPI0022E930B1|nr:thiol reductant ABC exporter subunit CydD [Marinicauda sp. Alg238-R41]